MSAPLLGRIKPCESLDRPGPDGPGHRGGREDLAAKVRLFQNLEVVCSLTGPSFASNTSSLSITALAARLKQPERMVGMHFFNPAR